MPVGYMPVGYLPVGYMPVGYMPVGYMPVGYMPVLKCSKPMCRVLLKSHGFLIDYKCSYTPVLKKLTYLMHIVSLS